MPYVYENLNPKKRTVGDCAIRATAKACGLSWNSAFIDLCGMGLHMKNLPNANEVWGAFLKSMGFVKCNVSNTCPDCYTIRMFAEDHPHGIYVIGTGTHVVCCIDSNYYDIWDSGDETVAFYWKEVEL